MGMAGYVYGHHGRLRRVRWALLAPATTRGFLRPAFFTVFTFLFLETLFWLLREQQAPLVGILANWLLRRAVVCWFFDAGG
jgi:hypothetical protein